MSRFRKVVRTCLKTGEEVVFDTTNLAGDSIGVRNQVIYKTCYNQGGGDIGSYRFEYLDESVGSRTPRDIEKIYEELAIDGYTPKNKFFPNQAFVL